MDVTKWDNFGPAMIGGVGGAMCLIFFVLSLIDLLKITLAPRVWLIEYAAALVK